MMTRFFYLAAATGLSLGLTGCLGNGTTTCSVTQTEPILTATGPRTIALNQTAAFTVSYLPQSSCATLDGFSEQSDNVTNSVNVGVRITYNGCDCPALSTPAQTTYSFKPTKTGTYYLRFITAANIGYITDTLTVQ
ncbi:MAG: hypothetical protein EOO36_22180 [Cytophagaceae bacterium]|nr:MAG: hypothetical protein EOO36_22180 [Cytophagaceae bacterium]